MSIALTWEEPPKSVTPPRGPSRATLELIEALKSKPGQWARIRTDVNVNVSTWWKKQPGIEAKASTINKPKNKCDVYARYVGSTK